MVEGRRGAKENLVSVGVAISDGTPVDWVTLEAESSSEAEHSVLEEMRVIEGIARFFHTAPGSGDDAEGPDHRWGRYEMNERLGVGSFGEVFRARDTDLDREVALKILRFRTHGGGAWTEAVLQEGRMMARVRHPNVVSIFAVERSGDEVALVMELLRGRALADLVREQGPLSAREACVVGLDLCAALAAIHAAGLVHRDIKASNVMRESGGRIVLMDFGLGVDLASALQEGGTVPPGGTPLYMAQEVLHGNPPSPLSDIYGLGVLLYHLVTGDYPVESTTVQELREKHAQGAAKLLRDVRADLPVEFVRVIDRALSPIPGDRFATAGEMGRALAAAASPELEPTAAGSDAAPIGRSKVGGVARWLRRHPLFGAGVVLAVAAVIALFAARHWTAVTEPYTVRAELYRKNQGGVPELLLPGAQLSLGDGIYLEFETSRDAHLYVVTEDDHGEAYLLFPLPDHGMANPVLAGRSYRLPSRYDGTPLLWGVSSHGGREHFLLIASPAPLREIEEELANLPSPRVADAPALPLPAEARAKLRGVGLLFEDTTGPRAQTKLRLTDLAEHLGVDRDTARRIWVRQIDFENPDP